MSVPFIDLKRTTDLIAPDVTRDWSEILAKCEFVGGPRVTELERKLAPIVETEHVVACANGTDAIVIALQAAGLGAGSKVAVPDLTFWATYEAVVQIGATPVLVDIDPNTLQMNFDELKAAHAKFGLNGAILVHLMGFAAPNLGEFRSFCRNEGIRLIEDGAQCFGVEVEGRPVYSGCEIATLSFYPAKVVGGCMDGGAIVTDSGDLAAACRTLANHGRKDHYSYSAAGWNSRMAGLNAAFLLRFIEHHRGFLDSRRAAHALYASLLKSDPDLAPKVRMFEPCAGVTGNGYLAVFNVDGRDGEDLKQGLAKRGIGAGRVYPEAISQQAMCERDLRVSALPEARGFSKRVINLPLFAFITEDEVRESWNAFRSVILEG